MLTSPNPRARGMAMGKRRDVIQTLNAAGDKTVTRPSAWARRFRSRAECRIGSHDAPGCYRDECIDCIEDAFTVAIDQAYRAGLAAAAQEVRRCFTITQAIDHLDAIARAADGGRE